MDSNTKNAAEYSLVVYNNEEFQANSIHIGVKNVVKIIRDKEIPSIPKTILLFEKESQ
jgi:hypothetical protein